MNDKKEFANYPDASYYAQMAAEYSKERTDSENEQRRHNGRKSNVGPIVMQLPGAEVQTEGTIFRPNFFGRTN